MTDFRPSSPRDLSCPYLDPRDRPSVRRVGGGCVDGGAGVEGGGVGPSGDREGLLVVCRDCKGGLELEVT